MEERIKPVRRVAIGILAVALIAAAPWIGLWTLLPLGVAAGLFAAGALRGIDATWNYAVEINASVQISPAVLSIKRNACVRISS